MTPIEGVDYAWSHPGGAALAAAGKRFASRYLTWPHAPASSQSAFLTADEIADLHLHGVAVVANFESSTDRYLAGPAGGTADGTSARVEMSRLGFPPGSGAYVSIDATSAYSAAGLPVAYAYFRAFVVAVGSKYRPGLYGGSILRRYVQARGVDPLFWQAAALSWSGGRWDPSAHVQQYRNGQKLNGATVDLDRALVADYGQWAAPQLPETDTEVSMPIYTLGGMRTGQVAAGTPYYTNPGDTAPRSKTSVTGRYLLTATDSTGGWYALDGGYAGTTGAKPVMCGWVKASVVTGIESVSAAPAEVDYTLTVHVRSAKPPAVSVTP